MITKCLHIRRPTCFKLYSVLRNYAADNAFAAMGAAQSPMPH